MVKITNFNFASLSCGSGGSLIGLIKAGGKALYCCDNRKEQIANIQSNFPNILSEIVDARWFYNRKQKGTDDLLNKIQLNKGGLDLLECSVLSSPTNIKSKVLPNLYDFFGLAKRIEPKILFSVGPADLLRDKNFHILEKQLKSLRIYSSDNQLTNKYLVCYRVLNIADLGSALSRSVTVMLAVRYDVAQHNGIYDENELLNVFPTIDQNSFKTLGDVFTGIQIKKDEIEFWEKETIKNTNLVKASKFLPKNPDYPIWLPVYGSKQLSKFGYKANEATDVFRASLKQPVPSIEFYDPRKYEKWGMLHPEKNRILTTTELKAIVGIPLNFKIFGNEIEKSKIISNIIPPVLYETFGEVFTGLLKPKLIKKPKNRKINNHALKIKAAEILRVMNKEIRAYNCDTDLGDSYARELEGHLPKEEHYDYLFDANEIGQDFIVYGPVDTKTGMRPVIGGVRKKVFKDNDHKRMISAIEKIKSTTVARGTCSPEPIKQSILDRLTLSGQKFQLSKDGRSYRVWKEAKGDKPAQWDTRWRTNPIPSATEGWTLDKNTNVPKISKGFANNKELREEFDFLNQKAEHAYYKIAPVEFKKQKKFLQSRVSSEFRLGKTVFTTLAINKYGDEMPAMNYHIDSNDENSGLTTISVFNQGRYEGGYFVLPQYRCAFKVGDGDVFVGNSRKIHGVTQLEGRGKRLSVVSYANTYLGYEEYAEKAYPPKSPRPNFRISNYQIGIPSFKRSETIKSKTLSLLARHNIDPKRVTIFVADETEFQIYEKSLFGSPYNKIVIAKPGIIGVRNFMRLYYKEGTPVLFIDDDIKDMEILAEGDKAELTPVFNLERDIIFRGFNVMREHNAYIWGIYAARNPEFMRKQISIGLYYIIASFYGNIIRHSDDLIIGTADKEDYERSVQHFIKDGRVVRLNFATANTNYYTERGGLQETRTKDTVQAGSNYMLEKYPKYCVLIGDRNKGKNKGMSEIRLNENT